MTFLYQEKNTSTFVRTDEDLHIVIFNDADKNRSVSYLRNVIAIRQRSDKEFYIAEIGDMNQTDAEREFADFNFDLDDEVSVKLDCINWYMFFMFYKTT